MQEKRSDAANNKPVTLDGATLRVLPTPRQTLHLRTLDQVRVEMAKVYRDMRQHKIDMADGTKLAFVLAQLGKLIEGADIESRIFELESRQEGGNK